MAAGRKAMGEACAEYGQKTDEQAQSMDKNGREWTDMDGKSRGATEFGGSSWECSSLVPRGSRPVPPPQWEHLIWEAMEMTTSREPIDDILEAIEDAQRAVAIAQERLLGIEEAWAQEAKDVWLVTAREALKYALRRLKELAH